MSCTGGCLVCCQCDYNLCYQKCRDNGGDAVACYVECLECNEGLMDLFTRCRAAGWSTIKCLGCALDNCAKDPRGGGCCPWNQYQPPGPPPPPEPPPPGPPPAGRCGDCTDPDCANLTGGACCMCCCMKQGGNTADCTTRCGTGQPPPPVPPGPDPGPSPLPGGGGGLLGGLLPDWLQDPTDLKAGARQAGVVGVVALAAGLLLVLGLWTLARDTPVGEAARTGAGLAKRAAGVP